MGSKPVIEKKPSDAPFQLVDASATPFDRRAAAGQGETPSATELVRALVEERWTVLIVAALGLVLAAAYLLLATPRYQSSVLVQVTEPRPLSRLEDVTAVYTVASGADTEIEIINSRAILGPVVEQFGLDLEVTPRRAPVIGGAFARAWEGASPSPARFGLPQYAWGGEAIHVKHLSVPESLVGKPLRLTALGDDRYRLTTDDGAPILEGAIGARAASATGGPRVELEVDLLVARPGTGFRVVKHSTAAAMKALRESLSVTEKGRRTGVLLVELQGPSAPQAAAMVDAIAATYLRHGLERLTSEAKATLDFLDAQIPVQKERLDKAEQALQRYQVRRGTILLSEEARALLARFAEVDRGLSELELEHAELASRNNPSHPDVRAVGMKMDALKARRAALEGELRLLPETEVATTRLTREVTVASELYTMLLRRAQELRILTSGVVANAVVLDPPLVADTPVAPRRNVVLVSGLLLGLVAGLAFALVRRIAGDRVDDAEAVESITGLPIYAAIPWSDAEAKASRRARRSPSEPPRVLATVAPEDPAIESLRTVRTAVEAALAHARNGIVAVGAPASGTGKSFMTVNLAHLLAASGRRVLLVDADLRTGALHRLFSMDRGPGLAELMAGAAPLEAVLRKTSVPDLDLLTTGESPKHPAEVLAAKKFESTLLSAAVRYDVVVVDTAPVLSVTDPVLVARCAGVNVLVLRPD
ncbi:MAG TPA: GNVR domain-containing protein, partial [Anaeromyxobacteraceae bacterium]|nr:GNVR domain-containing protein [Anaeromyxobacteraceae bacterium]